MRYALYYGNRYKNNLYQYLINSSLNCLSITDLTPDYFRSRQIKYIALDFDGVLASHGETKPLAEVEAWLIKITQIIPESHFALLSNKPFGERLQYFRENFPKIVIMSGVPKKPYPEGLNKLVEHFNCLKSELVLVDDRLLTGMLAVCLAGVQGVYVTKAYQNFKKRPIAESFFWLIRKIERRGIRWLEK